MFHFLFYLSKKTNITIPPPFLLQFQGSNFISKIQIIIYLKKWLNFS